MGLVQAVVGAVGGMFADQWKDFYTVPAGLPSTAALFAAVPQGTNAGRGSNTSGSSNIITNGSKIVVPEGYGLLLFQDGKITGFVAEPGGYEWRSDDLNSKSIFAGDGIVSPLITQSWERFKFGGQPGSQQAAFFVSLKELPDNKFGTQSEIYWDDGFLNTQVGAVTRGSYTLKIVDPILFVKNFVPASYLQPGKVFDFTDLDNAAAGQLFNEVVGSLAPAFSLYTNDPAKGNRITKLQQDSLGFAKSLSDAVEQGYQWKSDRGLAIVKTAIVSIEYDANTRELLKTVQRADARCPVRAAIPTCRPAWPRASSRPARPAAPQV
jgi:membrane protease subunit (stomatin/prohibitin family)